ncbi:MAG: hypothetical protein KKD39_04820 [Candidatus Altiarchaeota archaeon]|nr:hypothetical protein [Candidatus Altiarchaeota archaeon]
MFELGNEMGLNVRDHTGGGVFLARMIKDKGDIGVEFVVLDRGPGIKDLSQALEMGWSGGKGSGYGMYVLRSVADEFEVESVVGSGTKIVGRKFFKA